MLVAVVVPLLRVCNFLRTVLTTSESGQWNFLVKTHESMVVFVAMTACLVTTVSLWHRAEIQAVASVLHHSVSQCGRHGVSARAHQCVVAVAASGAVTFFALILLLVYVLFSNRIFSDQADLFNELCDLFFTCGRSALAGAFVVQVLTCEVTCNLGSNLIYQSFL